jgi:hypothetical protein
MAFLRWGPVGAVCALLALVALAWWLVVVLAWLVEGLFFGLGALAGLGYVVLLISLVRWLRGRRVDDHLLNYGRRGWDD